MKLGAGIFVVSALALAGCASTCPAPAAKAAAQAPVVSTTRLTSSDLAETEYAPLVSKPQHAVVSKDDDTLEPKDGHRRVGGGFSGYK
ncbi:MAG: hypothetical protein U0270_05130 [Labilithrix sp.]